MFASFIAYMHGKGNLKNLYIKLRIRKEEYYLFVFFYFEFSKQQKTLVKRISLLTDFSYMSSLFHSDEKLCYNPRKYPNGKPKLEDLEKQKVIVNE